MLNVEIHRKRYKNSLKHKSLTKQTPKNQFLLQAWWLRLQNSRFLSAVLKSNKMGSCDGAVGRTVASKTRIRSSNPVIGNFIYYQMDK